VGSPPARRIGEAAIRVPGTCGELVQGTLDGISFHISCPIDIFSTVRAKAFSPGHGVAGPQDRPKAIAAAERTLKYLSVRDIGIVLQIDNPLPLGKGMASSTADVAGAIYATSMALNRCLSAQEAAELALAVEPTDGSIFPNIVLFDHKGGRLYEELGPPPDIEILVLVLEGSVDTLEFNRNDYSHIYEQNEGEMRAAIELVRQGIKEGNPWLVGEGATLSAMCHQKILFKPQLEQVVELAREVNALGVNVAHSGTAIGMLLPSKAARQNKTRERLEQFVQESLGLREFFWCRLVGGGRR